MSADIAAAGEGLENSFLGSPSICHLCNPHQHPLEIIRYFVVGEAQHTIPFRFEHTLPFHVHLMLIAMYLTIQFNDQPAVITEKVHYKGRIGDRVLAAKLQSTQVAVTQASPQPFFC